MSGGFKLEVERLKVRLATSEGEKRQATFFLHVSDDMSSPATALHHQLDDPALDFLPCSIDDRTTLVQTRWITYVELDSDLTEWEALEEVGAVSQAVELDLVTGERLVGTLMVEGPEYTRRVSDFLNRVTARFILLRADGMAIYVNRRAIARVRLEES